MRKCLILLLAFTFYISALNSQKADSIKLNNAALYYYTYGAGEPILILSGGPGVASHQEDDVAINLSKHYKAILFDQRAQAGRGPSPWTAPP